MATFTSQILVGHGHAYDGGINGITHTLFLSENSRPAWVLQKEGSQKEDKIIWIPTAEHMLEDALVMIGLYVYQDEELLAMRDSYFTSKHDDFIELYEAIRGEHLEKMYARCREIESRCKLMLSVYEGSTIRKHLPVLQQYDCDIEVCLSVYQKTFSVWNGRREESGELSRE